MATAPDVGVATPVPANAGRQRVLLIADDPYEAETVRWGLRAVDFESVWVRHGSEGVAMARHGAFDLIIVAVARGHASGWDVVRLLRAESAVIPLVIIMENVPAEAGGAPIACAGTLVKRPFTMSDVLLSINAALRPAGATGFPGADHTRDQPTGARPLTGPQRWQHLPGSAAERWAHFVLRAIDARVDPKTVGCWARSLGVSRSVLCESCRLVQVAARDARDFARLMRAICHSGDEWQPEAVLDVADGRTLNKLFARAGLSSGLTQTPTVAAFLDRQRWIPFDNSGLMALKGLLVRHALQV